MRNIFGEHSAPVAASRPALGMIIERIIFFGDFYHAHLHAAMNGADQHVDLVTLHQLVGILRRFCRFGFVINRKIFQLTSAELVAALGDRKLEPVGDGDAELRIGAGIGKHHTDADFLRLRECEWLRQQRAATEQGGRGQKFLRLML